MACLASNTTTRPAMYCDMLARRGEAEDKLKQKSKPDAKNVKQALDS